MNKKYLIDENELIKLVKAKEKLNALECGGVDNWEWYSLSFKDYLEFEDEDNKNHEDFDSLAKDIISKEYEVYNEK